MPWWLAPASVSKAQERSTNVNSLRLNIITACMVGVASISAWAGDVKVIANPNVKADSISKVELKSLFLGQTHSLVDGTRAEPVLIISGPVHEAFVTQYLGISESALQNYYRRLVFTGKDSMPRELHSEAQVLAYVSRTTGAIGYVSAANNVEGVKTLAVVGVSNSYQRALLMRVEPEYPETLKLRQIGGTVRLAVTISPKGSVENVQVIGGNPILAETAIKAVQQWIYAAASSPTKMEVSLSFDPHH
jgi:TonB family protein